MITTVLIDYDGTIHDWDTVLIRSHDGILGLSGEEFHKIWTFDIHRGIIHKRFKERHDDTMFHCLPAPLRAPEQALRPAHR